MSSRLQTSELQGTVERLHGCHAKYRECVQVTEDFDGQPAWRGNVSVFDVDHPDASTCFAWSSPIEGSERRRYYAILKKPPIETAADAVRAAIVADHKGWTSVT